MDNRQALLEGAKRCIAARGMARTTARDIAAEAGVSLAAIGYHFRSKDALLAEAMTQVIGEGVGGAVTAALAEHSKDQDGTTSFGAVIDQLLGAFPEQRDSLAAGLQNAVRAQHDPSVMEQLRAGQQHATGILAAEYSAHVPDAAPAAAAAIGALYNTLVNGLTVMWLIDPDHMPTGSDLAAAIAALAR